jgi:polysaccharide export outer membrane protein
MYLTHRLVLLIILAVTISLSACSGYPELPASSPDNPLTTKHEDYLYHIGPGDVLRIFVWRNPEVSVEVKVRPDGMVSTPLVEDLVVSEKTSTEVARELEEALSVFIKEPIVTVSVDNFEGPYKEQVRVIGQAAEPQALSYSEDMTLLDVMILVGGLTEFADGNNAVLARVEGGQQKQYTVRLEDLVQDGDLDANIDILPGDIIIIPESWF